MISSGRPPRPRLSEQRTLLDTTDGVGVAALDDLFDVDVLVGVFVQDQPERLADRDLAVGGTGFPGRPLKIRERI